MIVTGKHVFGQFHFPPENPWATSATWKPRRTKLNGFGQIHKVTLPGTNMEVENPSVCRGKWSSLGGYATTMILSKRFKKYALQRTHRLNIT